MRVGENFPLTTTFGFEVSGVSVLQSSVTDNKWEIALDIGAETIPGGRLQPPLQWRDDGKLKTTGATEALQFTAEFHNDYTGPGITLKCNDPEGKIKFLVYSNIGKKLRLVGTDKMSAGTAFKAPNSMKEMRNLVQTKVIEKHVDKVQDFVNERDFERAVQDLKSLPATAVNSDTTKTCQAEQSSRNGNLRLIPKGIWQKPISEMGTPRFGTPRLRDFNADEESTFKALPDNVKLAPLSAGKRDTKYVLQCYADDASKCPAAGTHLAWKPVETGCKRMVLQFERILYGGRMVYGGNQEGEEKPSPAVPIYFEYDSNRTAKKHIGLTSLRAAWWHEKDGQWNPYTPTGFYRKSKKDTWFLKWSEKSFELSEPEERSFFEHTFLKDVQIMISQGKFEEAQKLLPDLDAEYIIKKEEEDLELKRKEEEKRKKED